MSVAISFINGKGGVGKTVSSVNVAGCFSKQGKRVLLIDADPQGNASTNFGLSSPKRDFFDLVVKDHPFEEVVVKLEENLDMIPMTPHEHDAYLSTQMSTMPSNDELVLMAIEDHMKDYDYIIFDGPPALGIIAGNILRASDLCIAPVLPEIFSAKGAQAIWKLIAKVKRKNTELRFGGFLFTQYNVEEKNNDKKEIFLFLKDLKGQNEELRVFNVTIRRRKEIATAIAQRTHVYNIEGANDTQEDYRNVCIEIENIVSNASAQ